MALISCIECGKEISDQAKACPFCGYPLKKKGKGFAIASLVLGIISCVYSFPLLAFIEETNTPKEAFVAIAVYVMIFAILSLIFGIISHKKGCALKQKTAGLVLSIISIVISLVAIFLTVL